MTTSTLRSSTAARVAVATLLFEPGGVVTVSAPPDNRLPRRVPRPDAATVVGEKGDTLWELAEEKRGTGLRWARLYVGANRAQACDPDCIYLGQVLDVPINADSAPARTLIPTTGELVATAGHETTTSVPPLPPRVGTPNVEPGGPVVEPATASPTHEGPSRTQHETARGSVFNASLMGGGGLLDGGLLSLRLVRRRMEYRASLGSDGGPNPRRAHRLRPPSESTGLGGSTRRTTWTWPRVNWWGQSRARDGVTSLPDVAAVPLSMTLRPRCHASEPRVGTATDAPIPSIAPSARPGPVGVLLTRRLARSSSRSRSPLDRSPPTVSQKSAA